MPRAARAAFLSARLACIPKSAGGLRILGNGACVRHMVGRSAAKVLATAMRRAAGDQQYGLAPDGRGALYRHL